MTEIETAPDETATVVSIRATGTLAQQLADWQNFRTRARQMGISIPEIGASSGATDEAAGAFVLPPSRNPGG